MGIRTPHCRSSRHAGGGSLSRPTARASLPVQLEHTNCLFCHGLGFRAWLRPEIPRGPAFFAGRGGVLAGVGAGRGAQLWPQRRPPPQLRPFRGVLHHAASFKLQPGRRVLQQASPARLQPARRVLQHASAVQLQPARCVGRVPPVLQLQPADASKGAARTPALYALKHQSPRLLLMPSRVRGGRRYFISQNPTALGSC